MITLSLYFFFQAEDGIRDVLGSRGLGDVYKRQPINSMPVSWAINVVPHIKVHPSALKIETDLDIKYETYNYMANLKAKFLPKLSLISLQNLAASAPSIIL